MLFSSGSIITQTSIELLGPQISGNVTAQVQQSTINALSPRFTVDPDSFSLLDQSQFIVKD
jgi:hypothetical protein